MTTERRAGPVPRLTITQILDLMQQLADDFYDGDLQNNAWEIFNRLSLDSRRTFLRKSLMLQWETQIDLARTGLQDVVLEDGLVIRPLEVEKERRSIEEVHFEEQQKLKTWLFKFLAVMVVIVTVMTGLVLLYTGGKSAGGAEQIMERIGQLMDIIF